MIGRMLLVNNTAKTRCRQVVRLMTTKSLSVPKIALTKAEKEAVQALRSRMNTGGMMLDDASILSLDERKRMNAELELIRKDTGAEVAVLTWDQLCENDDAAWRLATAVFDEFGIGKARDNNGVLVLLFRASRRLQLRTGAGTKAVVDDDFLDGVAMRLTPLFAHGQYQQGLSEAVQRIGTRLRAQAPYDWLFGSMKTFAAIAAFVIAVGTIKYYKEQRCPKCSVLYIDAPRKSLLNVYEIAAENEMTGSAPLILDHEELQATESKTSIHVKKSKDNTLTLVLKNGQEKELLPKAHPDLPEGLRLDPVSGDIFEADPLASRLSPCQLLERRLNAVAFRDVVCPSCETTSILSSIRFSSNYTQCPHCSCRTAKERRLATSSALTAGRAAYVHHYRRTCDFCHKSDDWTTIVPNSYAFEEAHGHSGGYESSSSSFGGGNSSNGGGASTSW